MGYVTGEQTREALLDAAERLMAEHGIDGVSLRTIQEAAGQANKSAVNHYFGDRDGLLLAIGIRHRERINPARHRLLDALEETGRLDFADLAAALVHPAADECLGKQSGRDYLAILGEAMARRGAAANVEAPEVPHFDSGRRLNALIAKRLGGSIRQRRIRIGESSLTATVLLADVGRAIDRDDIGAREIARRVSTTVSITAAVLTAPMS